MTHAKEESFRNSEEEYWANIDVNDCGYLLRTLEREAYTAVVNALRAKGPPSEYSFILLDHLKSALSISDELGRAEIRRASADPKLSKVASLLNPSYDTNTEWIVSSVEARGSVEAGTSRGKPFAQSSTNCLANKLLSQALLHNESIDRESGRSVELLTVAPKPFVPERLRLLLRETDRPEQRIPPPLEIPPPLPAPIATPVTRSRSDARPPTTKKRKQRTSKGAGTSAKRVMVTPDHKIEPIVLDGMMSLDEVSDVTPMTPMTVSAVGVVGSAGSAVISPGEPPQSGDAMKTWVSKIHQEQEAVSAANNKKNGAAPTPVVPSDPCLPSTSTSTIPTPEDPVKKKRRTRAPVQDPFYLNSCARTRPFHFEPKSDGRPKPPRGNPDKRSSTKRGSPGDYGCSFTAAVMSGATSAASYMAAAASGASQSLPPISTPVTRPPESHLGYGNRPIGLDESPSGAAASSTASPSAGGSPAGLSGGTRQGVPTPSTPTSHTVKRGGVYGNVAPRTQSRNYWVNQGGGPTTPSHSSPTVVRTNSSSGTLGGRTASMGSQQLSGLQATSPGGPLSAQKASMSMSNSSMQSMSGGSMGSAIGASGSSSSSSILLTTDPAVPVSALPPEEFGHDYGVSPMPPPPTGIGLSNATAPAMRMPPRILPSSRGRITNPVLRSPGVTTSPQHFAALNGLSPNAAAAATLPPSSMLQRAGSMSSIRPRTASKGAETAAGAAPVAPVGERPTVQGRVTDNEVQAKVDTIMLEAAQKELSNGKRTSVPKELLEKRDNGMILSHHSPAPASSSQSMQFAVCRTNVPGESDAAEMNAAAAAAAALPPSTPLISTGLGSSGLNTRPSSTYHHPPPLSSLSSLPSSPFIPSHLSSSSVSATLSSMLSSPAAVPSSGSPSPLSLLGPALFGTPSSNPLPHSSLTQHPPVSMPTMNPMCDPTMERLQQMLIAANAAPLQPGGGGIFQNPLSNFSAAASTMQQPLAAAAAAAPPVRPAAETRPSLRQYMLQPAGYRNNVGFSIDYTRDPKNPLRFDYEMDTPPVQYVMPPEELYDQGVLARPSTSGMNVVGGGGGMGMGMGSGGGRETTRRDNPVHPAPISIMQQVKQQTAAASAAKAAASFRLQSTSGTTMSVDTQSTSHERPTLHHDPASAATAAPAAPSSDQGGSEVTDILQQSCMELR